MKVLDPEVVKNYRWNKAVTLHKETAVVIFLLILVAAMALLAMRSGDMDAVAIAGVLMTLAVAGICVAIFIPFERDKNNSAYPMLKRWDKYSGLSICDFPTSQEYSPRGYKRWAVWRMGVLALAVVKARSAEKKMKDCKDAEDVLERSIFLSGAEHATRMAENAFLGFWQLVVGDLRILHGPQWQNPDIARENAINSHSQREKKLSVDPQAGTYDGTPPAISGGTGLIQ
jgi:hypothetical protein